MVETILGAAIVTMVLIGLAQVGQFTFRVVGDANLKIRAAFLAEEGIEALRTLRDAGWNANISGLTAGSDYRFDFSGSTWQLVQIPPPPAPPPPLVDNIFDRRVTFSDVYRSTAAGDTKDDIVFSGGALDANTRKAVVTVAWTSRGSVFNTSLATYLANLFAN